MGGGGEGLPSPRVKMAGERGKKERRTQRKNSILCPIAWISRRGVQVGRTKKRMKCSHNNRGGRGRGGKRIHYAEKKRSIEEGEDGKEEGGKKT